MDIASADPAKPRFAAHDHALIQYHVALIATGPGVGVLQAPLDPGPRPHDFVSSLKRVARGARASAPEGLARWTPPMNCGPLP